MRKFEELTRPDAKAWEGLRLPARTRLAAATRLLIERGTLQRADVMALGEVSEPQASLDIRQILNRVPELMEYDTVNRCYRLKEGNQAA